MAAIRHLLDRLGLYYPVRYSRGYELLLRRRDPAYFDQLHRDLTFYRAVLGGNDIGLIFDVGANYGDKAWAFTRLARRVVCVEPDPQCLRALAARFRRPAVVTAAAAVGRAEGHATFHRVRPGSAYNSLSDKHVGLNASREVGWEPLSVPVTTLDALIAEHGLPDFVKVDVEGFEVEVFRGLSRPLPAVCFEANLPAFAQETVEVIDRLTALDPAYRFNARSSGGYELLFPAHVGADDLRGFARTGEPGAYDLFAFRP